MLRQQMRITESRLTIGQLLPNAAKAIGVQTAMAFVCFALLLGVASTSNAAFMDFVVVDDPGNVADVRPVTYGANTSFLGSVAEMYRIGTYEVTNSQYATFLNAVASTDTYALYNTRMGDPSYGTDPNLRRGGITRSGLSGNYQYSAIPGRENLPVNWVSWNAAARFANWMHNGRLSNPSITEFGAYDFQNSSSPVTHDTNSKYWLPTVDEWYKAAFYKGGSTNAGYWTYATQSNSVPSSGPLNNAVNKANYQADNYDFGDGLDHGDMTPVGTYTLSPGPYGTFDQAGNVYEWNETISPLSNSSRTRYGGAWRWNDSEQLEYDARTGSSASTGRYDTGFRIASSVNANPKKIIQFGYDNPDTAYMRDNIAYMKTFPFHGTVFGAKPLGGTLHEFSHNSWGSVQYSRAQMQHAVDELQATDFGGFSENFLRMNVTPGDVDWITGNFSAVEENFATAGWIVQQGGAKGIVLDAESYGSPIWHYPSQAHASTHSFEAYKQSARDAGRNIMISIQEEAPDITIFLTFAHSYVWGAASQLDGDQSKLSTVEYGLLPSFLDGMIDAAGEGVRFVDGFEYSYRTKDFEDFQMHRQLMTKDALPIVENPAKYLEKFGFGFGQWMDVDWRTGGWSSDPNEFDQNWFTPEEFQNALSNALLISDEYAWVYTESLTWWNANGGDPMPSAYRQAVENAFALTWDPMLVGDYNSDGKVDTADYTVWRDSLGTFDTLPNDPIGGTIGTAQYELWRAHFGETVSNGGELGSQSSVPEVNSDVMLIVGIVGIAFYQLNSCRRLPF